MTEACCHFISCLSLLQKYNLERSENCEKQKCWYERNTVQGITEVVLKEICLQTKIAVCFVDSRVFLR